MTASMIIRLARPTVAGLLAIVLSGGGALAHGPDPVVGGKAWAPDQAVTYQWRAGQEPPAWMAAAIDRAAADVNASRGSRAATFSRVASGAKSLIAYGEPSCAPAGLACFDRSGAPSSFKMWFRAHGFVFDWGVLRWCEALAAAANGCFEAETIALDEFGHVEILGHHVNLGDASDFTDAVVQTVSRARPQVGWQSRALARCDVARLQLEYDRLSPAAPFSTCLAVPTAATVSATSTNLWVGDTVTITATLRTTSSASNGALAGDPVSARIVTLRRRSIGATAWTSMGTMTPSSTLEGSYTMRVSPTATYEWSAAFSPATTDGAVASTSAAMRITVSGCSIGTCPKIVGAPS